MFAHRCRGYDFMTCFCLEMLYHAIYSWVAPFLFLPLNSREEKTFGSMKESHLGEQAPQAITPCPLKQGTFSWITKLQLGLDFFGLASSATGYRAWLRQSFRFSASMERTLRRPARTAWSMARATGLPTTSATTTGRSTAASGPMTTLPSRHLVRKKLFLSICGAWIWTDISFDLNNTDVQFLKLIRSIFS